VNTGARASTPETATLPPTQIMAPVPAATPAPAERPDAAAAAFIPVDTAGCAIVTSRNGNADGAPWRTSEAGMFVTLKL